MVIKDIKVNSAAEAENFYNSLFSRFINCYYPFYVSPRDPETGKAQKNPLHKQGLSKADLVSQAQAKLYSEAVKLRDPRFISFGGLLDDNYMMVDIDNKDMSIKALDIVKKLNVQCVVIETFKGMHFIFRKPSDFTCSAASDIHLISGLRADYKFGGLKSNGKKKIMWELLKENGALRPLLWVPDTNTIDVLPLWLEPIKHNSAVVYKPDSADVYGVTDGSRNNSLWAFVCRMKIAERSYDEIREMAHFINNYIYDTQLDQNEMDIMLSDEHLDSFVVTNHGTTYQKKGNHRTYSEARPWEFIKNDSNNTKIDIDVLVQEFFKRYHCVVKGTAKYIYNENEGIYDLVTSPKDGTLFKPVVDMAGLMGTQWEKALNKIYGSWDLFARQEDEFSTGEYMFFKNCIVQFYKVDDVHWWFKTLDFTPSIFSDKKLHIDWTEDMSKGRVQAGRFDKFMSDITCGNIEDVHTLYELTASCMVTKSDGRVFFFKGSGANGKSTFVDAIRNLIGSDNFSAAPLSMLTSEHGLESIVGKMANICSDENGDFLRNVGLLKQIATGDTLQINPKGRNVYSYVPYATLVFCCNQMPIIKDNSNGMGRRSVVMQWDADFRGREDYSLIEYLKTPEALQYLAQNAVQHRCEYLSRNNQFTLSEKTKAATREFIDDQKDDIHYWFENGDSDNGCLTSAYFLFKTLETVARDYCEFSGIDYLSFQSKNRILAKDIRNRFGLILKKVKGQGQNKVFAPKDII